MREDLVSWQIESGCEEDDYKYSYFRSVYKKPKLGADFEFNSEDAEPVFAPVKINKEVALK